MSDISQGSGWRLVRRKVASEKATSGGPPFTSHMAGRAKRLWRLSGPIGAIVLVSGIIVASPGFSGSASADPTTQTISFAALANMQLGDAPFTVSATATSGLPVSFSIPNSASGVCTSTGTDGSTISLVGVGTCTVQADQAGDATYAQAPSVQRTFTVSQATPTVSITNIPSSGTAFVGSTFSPSYDYAGDGVLPRRRAPQASVPWVGRPSTSRPRAPAR